MHEMSLAEGVLQLIEDSARQQNFSSVSMVWLEIGELSGVEVEAMTSTCALDLADGEGATLDEIGAAQNISRERVRQIELEAIEHLRAEREMRRLA